MRPLKNYSIHINKHVHTKKIKKKKNDIMRVKNFNGGAEYEKTTNINLEQVFILNSLTLLNDTRYQNKPIYKLIHGPN